MVSQASAEDKALFLSLSNSMLNAGMGLGPLVGGLAIIGYADTLFALAAVLFIIITLLHHKLSTNNQALSSNQSQKIDFRLFSALKTPLLFSFLTFYLYFFFQNYLDPYVIIDHAALVFSTALVLNSLIVIFIQPLLSHWIEKSKFYTLMILGFLLIVLAMLALAFLGLYGIFIGTILILLAEVLLFLKLELQIVRTVPNAVATGLGTQRLSIGSGAFVSSIIGGRLFENYPASEKGLFWLAQGYQSVAIIGLCLLMLVITRIKNHSNTPQR